MASNEYDEMLSTGGQAGGSEYDGMLGDDREIQKSTLKQSMYVATQAEPDQRARVLEVAKRTSIPVDIVERYGVDKIEKKSQADSFDYDSIIDSNPKLAKWLENHDNAAVAKDDLDNLKGFERAVQDHSLLSDMGNALGAGLNRLNAGIARVPGLIYDTAALPQNLIVKAMGRPDLQVRAPEVISNNKVAQYYDRAAEAYGSRVPELDKSVVEELNRGEWTRAGKVLAVQLAANAPQQAAIIGATLMGAGIPALVATGAVTAADANKRSTEAGADPATATVNALAHGSIEAGFERLGTYGILKKWEGAIAKQYGKQVSREVMKDFGKTIFSSMAGEANEEAMTSIAQDFSDYITGVNPDALQGIGQRALDAGLIGGVSGGAMTAPSAIAFGVVRGEQVRRANQARDLYIAMGESAEASKLRERLPEAQRAFVEEVTKGSAIENLYIPVEAVEAYFQGKNIPAPKAMQGVGVLEAYEEAKETGGDVKIPLSTWIEKVVGTEHYQPLAGDIKFSPNDLSVNQIKAEKEKVAQELEVEAAAAQETELDQKIEESSGKVRSIVTDQLKAVGFDEKTSSTYASTVESFFRATGKKAGVDPFELFERYGLQIGRSEDPQSTADQVLSQEQKPPVQGVVPEESELEQLRARVKLLENELRTSEKTGLRNNRAFLEDESTGWTSVAAMDMDGLKRLNDSVGHEVADLVLKQLGDVLLKSQGENDTVRFYHRSGDEFAARFKDPAQSEQFMSELQERLDSVRVEITVNGKPYIYDGIGISFGTGENYEQADQKANDQKRERLAAGKREDARAPGAPRRLRPVTGDQAGGQGNGSSGQSDGGSFFQSGQVAQPFYSKLQQTVEQKMGGSASPEQIKGMLREIKPEEMKWSGLDEFLKGKEKVTKAELLEFLRANSLEIQEVTKGAGADVKQYSEADLPEGVELREDRDTDPQSVNRWGVVDKETGIVVGKGFGMTEQEALAGFFEQKFEEQRDTAPKFSQYVLPGGENYREVLLRLPPGNGQAFKFSPEDSNPESWEQKDRASFKQIPRKEVQADPEFVKAKKQLAKDVRKEHPDMKPKEISELIDKVMDSPRTGGDHQLSGASDELNKKFNELADLYSKKRSPYPAERIFTKDLDGNRYIIQQTTDLEGKTTFELGGYLRRSEGESFATFEEARAALESKLSSEAERSRPDVYKSSHWDEANVLAHVRLNDRTDADGKKVLFVEEIQSDWHQAGRKKGYKGDALPNGMRVEPETNKNLGNFRVVDAEGNLVAHGDTEQAAIENVGGTGKGQVPDAPFRKTWHEFAFKRIIRMAAEGGYDRVAWTTGEQQAERYDLSKQISHIEYVKSKDGTYFVAAYQDEGDQHGVVEKNNLSEDDLSDVIGKEVAAKIVAGEGKKFKGAQNGAKRLGGVDLKVGGEGMKGFYDKILPEFANKFGKKFGAKVGGASLETEGGDYTIEEDDGRYYIADSTGDSVSNEFGSMEEAEAALREYSRSSDKTKVHSIDITQALRDTALNEGFSLFQGDGSTPRGQIRFGKDRQFKIDLFKHFDLSTFLHETGHFYMEVMGDLAQREETPQQLKDDYAAILKWLGVESREDIKTEHHEQWARGFEAYLMEGKAPTSALREAFARIRTWLTAIYKRLQSLDVELTDEVRGVMDRMLATEEEINTAYGEQNAEALFDDPAAFGMTGKKAERYLKAREDARQAAIDLVNAKLMADFRRSEEAFYKEKREGVRAEVEKEISQQRAYKALSILQKGKTADGTSLPAEMQGLKISKSSIEEAFGKGFAKSLPRGITSKDGVHLEIVAELLEYGSGSDLITALEGIPKLDDAVEAETNRRMEELYPDSFKDGSISDEALKAIHNEKRSELLMLELEHLASNDMPVLKDVIRRVVRRPPTLQAVREQAKKIIGGKTVNELTPHLYQRAEARSAKEAGEALARGDISAAFEFKRKELLNHELYRAAVEARETVEKKVDWFKRISKADEKLAKSRDMDLVYAARAILAQFGLAKSDQPIAAYLKQMQAYDPDAFSTVSALVESATVNVGNYKEVSFDDFVAMNEAVEAIWELSKISQQIEIDGKIMNKEEIVDGLVGRFEEITKESNKGQAFTASEGDKTKLGLLGFKSMLRRVESWVDTIDEKGQEFRAAIFNPVSEGATKYRLARKDILSKFLDIIKPIEEDLIKKDIDAPELGGKFRSKSELLGALLHTGNESNLSKLLRGRGWGEIGADGELDTGRWDAFIARMQREGILTKQDYDVVQKVWDLFEETKPEAQAAHKKMYGYYFNEITAKEFQTPWGSYRGGYAPAKVDPFASNDAQKRSDKEALAGNNNSFAYPTTGRGFTKSRVERYAAPLSIDMRLVPQALDSHLRFIHIEPAVKAVARIIHDNRFDKALTAYDPTASTDMLMPWLQRSALQRVETPGETGRGWQFLNRMAKTVRTRTGLNVMVGNVTNTIQQITGLSISSIKVKPKYLRNAMWNYVGSPAKTAEYVSEKSDFMKTRTSSSSMEVQQHLDDLLLNPSKYEKARDFAQKHGYFLQSAAQNVVDTITWIGAYNQAVEKGHDEKKAIREADSAVRQTQGSFNPEDISRYEVGTPMWRLFTMFSGYFNMNANLLGTEFTKTIRDMGLKRGAGRMLYVYTFGFMVPAVISELIVRTMAGKGLDDDDDDQYLDDVMSIFFGSQFRTGSAMLPFVGPAANAGVNAWNDKQYDDRISTSPAISTIESTVSAPKSIYDAIAEDGSKKKAVRDALTAVGLLTGIPVAPLARPLGYLSDVSEGNARPSGPVDFTRGLVTGKAGETQ